VSADGRHACLTTVAGRISAAVGDFLEGTSRAVEALLLGLLALLPLWPRARWGLHALWHYTRLLATPSAIINFIIAGALVGASGLILTRIMCQAMNRTVLAVLFSDAPSAGAAGGQAGGGDDGYERVRSASADEVAMILDTAERVAIVPGYGLAVAQAQHAVRDLARDLEARGTEVVFGIHPVAGRMPGHMNVLLAEADVSYDKLFDLDDINSDFSRTDVALVVGANDVVNPSAREDEASPIYGMPILDVDLAHTAVVIKRSLSPGFAGIDNPLFYEDKTLMLFADAKQALQELVASVKEA